ncbi:MAG: hypothetical protein HND52_18815 [Ignavibacteriae bacterium]|nr:hypothetical protein [Ignavibacteriota bacterium]NOH00018.1 hypothetical protein [Ignavibacteriota bacterium]
MILLAEITSNKHSEDKTLRQKSIILSRLVEISNLLSTLNEKDFKELKSICIVIKESIFQKTSIRILKNFDMSYKKYVDENEVFVFDIYDKFLVEDELQKIQASKKLQIEDLIHKGKILHSTNELDTDKSYLCYLPFVKTIGNECRQFNNISLLEDYSKVKRWTSQTNTKFSNTEYSAVNKELKKHLKKSETVTYEEYSYKHPRFINNFNENYINELNTIREDNSINKGYFHGEDFLVAKKSIYHYMYGHDIVSYDLRKGVKEFNPDSSKIMFAHIDSLNDEQLDLFSKKIRPLEISRNKIAIQGLKIDLDFYLQFYRSFSIPDNAEIKSLITKLFIALLIEHGKIVKKEVRNLYSIIDSNGFKKLLRDLQNLEDLDNIIEKFSRLKIEDLTNPIFWLIIQQEIKRINKNSSLSDEKNIAQVQKVVWKFVDTGKSNWSVFYNDAFQLSKDSNAFTYLAIIIRYHELFNGESIDGTKLQRAVLKYQGDDYKKELENAQKSGAWRGQKNYLKKSSFAASPFKEAFSNFTLNHVKDEYDRVKLMNVEKFKFEIKFNQIIDETFFMDLSESQEKYD